MFETLLKIVESEFPTEVSAVIAASDRSAASSPYSIAVAPRSVAAEFVDTREHRTPFLIG